ncbi:MAG TPA: hypothetical protein VGF16_17965 [Bryobacteraceae bacterium]|jgi:hypothetical protein
MINSIVAVIALSCLLALVMLSRYRSGKAVDREKSVEASLMRALSAPELAERHLHIEDIHRLGERLLAALEAERRATDWLAECPQDRARIDDWLACRDVTIRLERQYAVLACEIGAEIHAIPRSWSPQVPCRRVVLDAPYPAMPAERAIYLG